MRAELLERYRALPLPSTHWSAVGKARRCGPHTAELALRVPDVAAAREALEAKGVAFDGDIFDTGVCHMAFFKDPDGNALMLHRRYAPSGDGS